MAKKRNIKKYVKKRFNIQRWWHWIVFVIVCVAVVLLAFGASRAIIKSHTFQFYGKIVPRVKTREKVVALTFDDGPLPNTTLQLLDILRRNEVHATFFELGKNVVAHPELTRAVAADGNEIGNHTYSHRSMSFMRLSRVQQEIRQTEDAFALAGVDKPTIFRPPYGDKFLTSPYYLSRHDYTTIMWNINPDDLSPKKLTSDKIVANVLERIQPGSIIVLHPEYKARKSSLEAVDPIIKSLKKQGYTFVTVSKLLSYQ